MLPLKSADMTGATKRTNYIASHSETGHHHIIAGDCMVLERDRKDTLVQLDADSKIEHIKTTDKHDTKPVRKGIYRLLRKREYDPFAKAMREVWD